MIFAFTALERAIYETSQHPLKTDSANLSFFKPVELSQAMECCMEFQSKEEERSLHNSVVAQHPQNGVGSISSFYIFVQCMELLDHFQSHTVLQKSAFHGRITGPAFDCKFGMYVCL